MFSSAPAHWKRKAATSSISRLESRISPRLLHIVQAAKDALDQGFTHYGPTQGLPELREAIAAYISQTRGITVGPQHVCVVPGGKPIIFFPLMALLEPGDEVICPDPGFPIYESMIRFLEAVPVPDYRFTERTKLVILNSPGNPTGQVIPPAQLEANRRRSPPPRRHGPERRNLLAHLYYDSPPTSIASLPGMLEKTIILDGFSKTYAMTGWRMGYGVMPEWLVEAVNKLMVNSNSCTATFTQRAGIAALTGPQEPVDRMVAEFRRRRDAFCAALNAIPGLQCPLPGGAFYAWARVHQTGFSSRDLADRLLAEAGVACLNGASFGSRGDGFLRFSYANSYENLMEAAARVAAFIAAASHPPG